MTISPEQQRKMAEAQAESQRHNDNAMVHAWRSPDARVQDRAELAKDKADLESMENKRVLFGGGEKHQGYMSAGVSNPDLQEKKDRIARREKDEKMYND